MKAAKGGLVLAVLLAAGGLAAVAADGAGRSAVDRERRPLPFDDGDVVVFCGDSITRHGWYHAYVWEYYLTRFPEKRISFYSAGIGGDTALGARRRFARDVASHKPTALAVMFGMNDVRGNLYAARQTDRVVADRRRAVEAFRENLAALDVLAAEAGIPLIYRLTPSPYDDTAVLETGAPRRIGWNAALGRLAEVVREGAAARGGVLVDFHSAMNALAREKQALDPTCTLVGLDRVHPAEPGHLLMAYTFLRSQGVDGLVSDVGLDFARREVEKSVKAAVSDVSWEREGVAFTVLEKALPMPIDEKARPILADVPFVRDLNQQILQVRSLPRGRWALEIDGMRVGAWLSPEWERGVNLAMNGKTPQYAQAQKVHAAVLTRKQFEDRLLGWRACKDWLDSQRVDSDDWAAVDRFWAAKSGRDGHFESLYPDFRANWDRRAELEAKIDAAAEVCRAAAKPVPHRCRIVRVPAYDYRGFMLDEARHFFGKEKVKELLDVMAEHKMNYFHWHLTDDQGWRVDLPGLPELVKAGARRDSSPKRGQDREQDGVPYGPFYYTAEDVREIVAYAKGRGIEVIPEIDLPGHTRTILAAHPEFCCKPREELRKPHSVWGVSKDVLCLGNPEAIAYVKKILDATCALFPCEYVHIGGDECPGGNWWECAKCRAKIGREGLCDCPHLQAAFTRDVADYLAKKGKKVIAWDEVMKAGELPKGMTVQVWHGNQVSPALEAGADVIVSTLEDAYLSIPTGEPGDRDWPYRKWVVDGKMTLPVSRIEKLDLEKGVPPNLRERILGGECCAWTEEMASGEELDFKVKRRLAAFGDVLFLGPEIPRSKKERALPEVREYPFATTVVVQGTQAGAERAVEALNDKVEQATGRRFDVRKTGDLADCVGRRRIYVGRGPELDDFLVGWWIDETYDEGEAVVLEKGGDLCLFGRSEAASLRAVRDFCADSIGTCRTKVIRWNGIPTRR